MEPAFFIFFIVFSCIILFISIKLVKDDAKARNNVKNFDPFARHFCFVLSGEQQKTIEQLSVPRDTDTLKYAFDRHTLTIRFFRGSQEAFDNFQLSFYVVENKTYMKASNLTLVSFNGKSYIRYKISRFFAEKIGATAVDYNFFESVVCPKER